MTTENLRQRPSLRVPGVPAAVGVTALLGLLAAGVGLLVAGRSAALGAATGAALVAGFFVFGALNTGLAAAYAPRVSMVVALLTYTLQVVGLGLVLVALTRSGATEASVDVRWLAATVIVGTFAWVGTLVVHALRTGDVASRQGAAG